MSEQEAAQQDGAPVTVVQAGLATASGTAPGEPQDATDDSED